MSVGEKFLSGKPLSRRKFLKSAAAVSATAAFAGCSKDGENTYIVGGEGGGVTAGG